MKPSIGRVVLFHFLNHRGVLTTRPADVVALVGDSGMVNLRVKYDGANDLGEDWNDPVAALEASWQTSVAQLADGAEPTPMTWSWPPRV